MNTTVTYDKVYFNDNYSEQFEALRNHYRARTRKALQGRKVDHSPVSNIDAVVYLHDDPNGGTYVTSVVDFKEHFNSRFGGSDRIGAARRSLENAARKAANNREMDKKRAAMVKRNEEKSFVPARSVRPRFAFLHAILALMLVLAIGLWGGSTMLLDRTEDYALALEEQVAVIEASAGEAVTDSVAESTEINTYMSIGGEDRVEIYPSEGVEISGLLSIFARLFQD